MAVHCKYGCGIKDLAGRHRRLIKKQPAPVRLVCTQVVDAQLTYTAGRFFRFCEPLQYTVYCPMYQRLLSTAVPVPCGRSFSRFRVIRLMATYVSMSSTLKMFWLLSTKVVPPPCADIKARDCSAV